METNAQVVAHKLDNYLHGKISLEDLVDWAEEVMLEGVISETEHDAVRDAVARIGVANVRAFGLTWQDVEDLLGSLGYRARVEITPQR